MKFVRTLIILTCWASAFLCCGVAASQECYIVRNQQGDIVYQSIRPPVDISVPHAEQIEAKFPGGYMSVDRVFATCGTYRRPTPAPSPVVGSPAEAPRRSTPAPSPMVGSPAEAPRGASPGKRSPSPDYGDYAKYVPQSRGGTGPETATVPLTGMFDDLIPKREGGMATEQSDGSIMKQLAPVPSETAQESVIRDAPMLALVWSAILAFGLGVALLVNRLDQNRPNLLMLWFLVMRSMRLLLGLLVLIQGGLFLQIYFQMKAEPILWRSGGLLIHVVIKIGWVALFMLIYDWLRRRINAKHEAKFGTPHPAMANRWGI